VSEVRSVRSDYWTEDLFYIAIPKKKKTGKHGILESRACRNEHQHKIYAVETKAHQAMTGANMKINLEMLAKLEAKTDVYLKEMREEIKYGQG
jgi:hypothetical protein